MSDPEAAISSVDTLEPLIPLARAGASVRCIIFPVTQEVLFLDGDVHHGLGSPIRISC